MPFARGDSRLVEWSCRFYKLLVCAYSPAFRESYGEEMAQVFGDCCVAAHRREGPWGLVPVWRHALMDLLHNAPAERVQDIAADDGARRLFLGLTPLALVLGGWVCWVDAHNGELHSPVLLLLLFATLLAFAQPRLAGLWGFFIGASVPLAHTIARWQGWQLPYPTNGWTPVFALLALVPALGGAAVGALLRALVTCFRANRRTVALVVVLLALAGAAVFHGVRALNSEPPTQVARLQHDPWQAFARKMDVGLLLFQHNSSSSSRQQRNPALMQFVAGPVPGARAVPIVDGAERTSSRPRDVNQNPKVNRRHKAEMSAE
jgi:hypothetical protein